MTKTAHTPLPWIVSGGDIWPVNSNPRVKIADIVKPSPMNNIDWQANAAFIVRACNSHYELLDAIKKIMTISAHMPSKRSGDINKIAADAFAKAEGGAS